MKLNKILKSLDIKSEEELTNLVYQAYLDEGYDERGANVATAAHVKGYMACKEAFKPLVDEIHPKSMDEFRSNFKAIDPKEVEIGTVLESYSANNYKIAMEAEPRYIKITEKSASGKTLYGKSKIVYTDPAGEYYAQAFYEIRVDSLENNPSTLHKSYYKINEDSAKKNKLKNNMKEWLS